MVLNLTFFTTQVGLLDSTNDFDEGPRHVCSKLCQSHSCMTASPCVKLSGVFVGGDAKTCVTVTSCEESEKKSFVFPFNFTAQWCTPLRSQMQCSCKFSSHFRWKEIDVKFHWIRPWLTLRPTSQRFLVVSILASRFFGACHFRERLDLDTLAPR